MHTLAPRFHQAMMNVVLFGLIVGSILHPISASDLPVWVGAVVLVFAFFLTAFLPIFFQPLLLIMLGVMILDGSSWGFLIGSKGGVEGMSALTALMMVTGIICAPLAYPFWDKRGNAQSLGPHLFVLPPIGAGVIAGIAYLAGAEPWLTIGLPAIALLWQLGYGLYLDPPMLNSDAHKGSVETNFPLTESEESISG